MRGFALWGWIIGTGLYENDVRQKIAVITRRMVGVWIAEPDEQALAHCNIFFNHRCVYGDRSLVSAWGEHIAHIVAARPAFFSPENLQAVACIRCGILFMYHVSHFTREYAPDFHKVWLVRRG